MRSEATNFNYILNYLIASLLFSLLVSLMLLATLVAVSYSYKLKHSMLIAGLLNLLPNQPSGLESAVHLLKYSKELAESPPSEDQKNFHTGAAEVFGGVCKGLIGTFKGIVNAEAAWNLMTPFLSDVLENIYRAAVEDWADGIRYGIHRAGIAETKPVLDLIMGKVLSTLWREKEGGGGRRLFKVDKNDPNNGCHRRRPSLSAAATRCVSTVAPMSGCSALNGRPNAQSRIPHTRLTAIPFLLPTPNRFIPGFSTLVQSYQLFPFDTSLDKDFTPSARSKRSIS